MRHGCTKSQPQTPRSRPAAAMPPRMGRGTGHPGRSRSRHGVPAQTVVTWYRRDNWTPARDRWRGKQLCGNEAAAKPLAMPPIPGKSNDDSRARKLQRLDLQLDALDNLIDNAKTPDDWHKLRYSETQASGKLERASRHTEARQGGLHWPVPNGPVWV